MGTLFITSLVLLLGIIIFAIYRRQQAASSEELTKQALPPFGRFNGLFGDGAEGLLQTSESEPDAVSVEMRAQLLARAAKGERETLPDAQAQGDSGLYEEVLNRLVEEASRSDKALLALVSYVTRHEGLRVNLKLAEALMANWQAAPARAATAKMLHLVALADDAGLYRRAIELALEYWRAGRIEGLTAQELRTLAEGEYWVLTSQARSSGAGFVLKRTLARLRRELERAGASNP